MNSDNGMCRTQFKKQRTSDADTLYVQMIDSTLDFDYYYIVSVNNESKYSKFIKF